MGRLAVAEGAAGTMAVSPSPSEPALVDMKTRRGRTARGTACEREGRREAPVKVVEERVRENAGEGRRARDRPAGMKAGRGMARPARAPRAARARRAAGEAIAGGSGKSGTEDFEIKGKRFELRRGEQNGRKGDRGISNGWGSEDADGDERAVRKFSSAKRSTAET